MTSVFLRQQAPFVVALAASVAVHVGLVVWLPARGTVSVTPAPGPRVELAAPSVRVQPEPVAPPASKPSQARRATSSHAKRDVPRVITQSAAPEAVPAQVQPTPDKPAADVAATVMREETTPPRAEVVARATPAVNEADLLAGYAKALSQAIASHRRYPRIAQARGWQGTVEVSLHIASGNQLRQVAVLRSSGFEVLDQHALEMVHDAVPLPAPPEPLRQREFNVRVPIVFHLKE